MEKIFGANWRTTLFGAGGALFALLTFLAALPYEHGDIATLIPPEYKSNVAMASAIATFLLRLMYSASAKDRQVTGGNEQNDTQ